MITNRSNGSKNLNIKQNSSVLKQHDIVSAERIENSMVAGGGQNSLRARLTNKRNKLQNDGSYDESILDQSPLKGSINSSGA